MPPSSSSSAAPSLMDLLAAVPDHRGAHGKRYPLHNVLGLACLAIMCGADSYAAIEEFGRDRHASIGPLFGFDRCMPPCAASYFNILSRIDAAALEAAVSRWIKGRGPGESDAIAVDGKTLRGSRRGSLPGLHLLAACTQSHGHVLAQLPVDVKTNEAKAVLELLGMLPLEGAVVTADAMFAQRDICGMITERGGDYVVAVKDNQPQLKESVELAFSQPVSPSGEAAMAA